MMTCIGEFRSKNGPMKLLGRVKVGQPGTVERGAR
jgi:hypothetical protein